MAPTLLQQQQQRAAPARHGQGSHCHGCRKPIVWPGLCYTCATGRPREIVRPDERTLGAPAAGEPSQPPSDS